MCMMLDLDACMNVFVDKPKLPAKVFREGINNQRKKLVLGGELKKELLGNGPFYRWYLQALQIGRVHEVNEDSVRQKHTTLESSGGLVSNDVHVIALAQAIGCRILCSLDKDLHRDFTDRALLNHPDGKVYPLNSSRRSRWLIDWLTSNTRRCEGEACSV